MAYGSRGKLLVELCLKREKENTTGCNSTNLKNEVQVEPTVVQFDDPSAIQNNSDVDDSLGLLLHNTIRGCYNTPLENGVQDNYTIVELEDQNLKNNEGILLQSNSEGGDSSDLLQHSTISGCYNTTLENGVQGNYTIIELEDQNLKNDEGILLQSNSEGGDSSDLLQHSTISGCYNTTLENGVQGNYTIIELEVQNFKNNEDIILQSNSEGGDSSDVLQHGIINGCYNSSLENGVEGNYTAVELEDQNSKNNEDMVLQSNSEGGDSLDLLQNSTISGCYNSTLENGVQDNYTVVELEDQNPKNNEDMILQSNSEGGDSADSIISDTSEEEHYTTDSSESENLEPRRQRKRSNVQINDVPEAITRDEILQNDEVEYNQQDEKALTRKRKRVPENWKRNKQRKLRLAGKEHLSQKGQMVRAKAVKVVLCKCHYNCNQKFNMQEREQIFQDFLSLCDERSRWAFISKCVSKNIPKRRYAMEENTPSRRQHTLVYTLTCGNLKHQVCKKFFLGTLDISGKKVENAMNKTFSSGIVEKDKRGLNPATNKIPEDRKEMVRSHIKSIPIVESHYCRSSSKRMYLPTGLSENRLYQDYLKFCEELQVIPVTSSFYKHIFTSEFNYGFHRPKKDQCDYCAQFQNKSEAEKLECQHDLDLHMTRKQEAREHKRVDKDRACGDLSFRSYTMDLEKILLTPQLGIGQLYYKRKLKTYNFTVYALADKFVTNYMWHETDGTKGSSEVATCLWQLLSDLPQSVSEVTFYSDTASGQNRNTILSAMFLRALSLLDNLKIINQKFMESGHSEMECDSVHSTIENRGRKIDIFVPDQWYTVARTAKLKKPPYVVKELNYSQFQNFKMYSQKLITNRNKNVDGINMRWLDVKWLQYRKDSPLLIYYKNQLSENEFKQLCIRRPTRKENVTHTVDQLYQSHLPIDTKKLKDLLSLCNSNKIPSVYHQFYQTLDATESTNANSDEDI